MVEKGERNLSGIDSFAYDLTAAPAGLGNFVAISRDERGGRHCDSRLF